MLSITKYLIFVLLFSCTSEAKFNQGSPKVHLAEIHINGTGSIFVDQIANGSIMVNPGETSEPFSTFMISFIDSIIVTDNEKLLDRRRYYQYRMQYDWSAIVSNVTYRPVFFHSKIKTSQNVDDFIMVFELPPGVKPDTIIYNDSFGTWGTQKIIYN